MGFFDKQISEALKKGVNTAVNKGIDQALSGKNKVRNTNVRENPLVTKITDSLDNLGLSEEEKQAKEAEKLAKEAEALKEKESSSEPARTSKDDVDDALDRLSVIADSLEEADKHQFIRDINMLTENANRYRRERPEWTLRLYGNKKA